MKKSLLDLKSAELFQKDNLKKCDHINCGEKVQKSISDVKDKKVKDALLLSFQKCYIAIITHLLKKLPERKSLRYFKCLDPSNIKKQVSPYYVAEIANLIPLNDIDLDLLKQEWQLLQIDPDISFVQKKGQRIDEYWSSIFALTNPSSFRYPLITRVVKAALSLPHGSADVERGFSDSAKILTKDRANMDEKTLNATLLVRDSLKKYDLKAHKVPITAELLRLVKNSYRKFSLYNEEKKREEEEAKKLSLAEKKRLEKEKKIAERMSEEVEDLKNLDKELEIQKEEYKKRVEATSAMQDMLVEISKKDGPGNAAILPKLIADLGDLRKKEMECGAIVEKINDKIRKRRSKLLDTSVTKKLKKN